MTASCNATMNLPDMLICGGDTTPWEIAILKEDGSPYPYEKLEGGSAVLTFSPYMSGAGMGADALVSEPEMTKNGEITEDENGNGLLVFSFSKADTADLQGKFLYQIEISYGSSLRVLQGTITIRANISRA